MDELELELCQNVDQVNPAVPRSRSTNKRRNSDINPPTRDERDCLKVVLSSPLMPRRTHNYHDVSVHGEGEEQHLPPKKRVKISTSLNNPSIQLGEDETGNQSSNDSCFNFSQSSPSHIDWTDFLGSLRQDPGIERSLEMSVNLNKSLDLEMDLDTGLDMHSGINPSNVNSHGQTHQNPHRVPSTHLAPSQQMPWVRSFDGAKERAVTGFTPALINTSFSSHGSNRSNRFSIYEDPDDMDIDESRFNETAMGWYLSPDDDKENTEDELYSNQNEPFHTLSEVEPNVLPDTERRASYQNYAHNYDLAMYRLPSSGQSAAEAPEELRDFDLVDETSATWLDVIRRFTHANPAAHYDTSDDDEEERLTDRASTSEEAGGNLASAVASLGALNATEISLHAIPSQSLGVSSESHNIARSQSRTQRPRSFNFA